MEERLMITVKSSASTASRMSEIHRGFCRISQSIHRLQIGLKTICFHIVNELSGDKTLQQFALHRQIWNRSLKSKSLQHRTLASSEAVSHEQLWTTPVQAFFAESDWTASRWTGQCQLQLPYRFCYQASIVQNLCTLCSSHCIAIKNQLSHNLWHLMRYVTVAVKPQLVAKLKPAMAFYPHWGRERIWRAPL
jgi:hypothetical protein